jgi:hypothetical protein
MTRAVIPCIHLTSGIRVMKIHDCFPDVLELPFRKNPGGGDLKGNHHAVNTPVVLNSPDIRRHFESFANHSVSPSECLLRQTIFPKNHARRSVYPSRREASPTPTAHLRSPTRFLLEIVWFPQHWTSRSIASQFSRIHFAPGKLAHRQQRLSLGFERSVALDKGVHH